MSVPDPAVITDLPPYVIVVSGTDVDGNAVYSVPNPATPPPELPAIPPLRTHTHL